MTILFAVRVTVVDELSGRILYLKVPSAITYCLSMMAMVGMFSTWALMMLPAMNRAVVLSHLVKVASTNCLFVSIPLPGVETTVSLSL